MRMLRRIITMILVLATIGAIINIAIAWMCVVASKTRTFNARHLGQARAAHYKENERLANAGVTVQDDLYLASLYESAGTRVLVTEQKVEDSPWPIKRNQHDAGWPLLSLRAIEEPDERGRMQAKHGAKAGKMHLAFPPLPTAAFGPPSVARQALPLANPPAPPVVAIARAPAIALPTSDRLLPLRPIWPGFAINTIYYAGAAWLCWLFFTLVMRTQRRLRGLCGGCAYPVGVSPVCTECGRKVRGKSVPSR